VVSEETSKKLSEAMSGEGNPCYGRKGPEHPSYGRVVTEETKQKTSKTLKGREVLNTTKVKISESTSGEKNHRYGKKDSEEVKQRKSDGRKGQVWWVNREGKTTQSTESPGQEWKRGRVW
jgi:hypothetical protein